MIVALYRPYVSLQKEKEKNENKKKKQEHKYDHVIMTKERNFIFFLA
jgi:hypothetical protein